MKNTTIETISTSSLTTVTGGFSLGSLFGGGGDKGGDGKKSGGSSGGDGGSFTGGLVKSFGLGKAFGF